MRYYYIHGFNSGKNSSTGQRLRDALKEEVISLSYDSSKKFEENYISLLEQISERDDFCVIGTSLGAFYANLVASFYGMPCVMFNPVVDASVELFQFLGENENFDSGERYIFSEETLSSYENANIEVKSIPRTIFVSSEDEVLRDNVQKVMDKYSSYSDIYITGGGHRIVDFTPFVEKIKETANTFCV